MEIIYKLNKWINTALQSPKLKYSIEMLVFAICETNVKTFEEKLLHFYCNCSKWKSDRWWNIFSPDHREVFVTLPHKKSLDKTGIQWSAARWYPFLNLVKKQEGHQKYEWIILSHLVNFHKA